MSGSNELRLTRRHICLFCYKDFYSQCETDTTCTECLLKELEGQSSDPIDATGPAAAASTVAPWLENQLRDGRPAQ